MDIINDLILQATASPWLPLLMLAVAIVDGFFPPVPSETVLIAAVAGAASSGAWPTVALVALMAALGAVIGDNLAYLIGRRVGTTRYRWLRTSRLAAALKRAQDGLRHRGAAVIVGARFIPIGRVAVNLAAGALAYPPARFRWLAVAGAGLWASYSAIIGAVAGQWFQGQPLLGTAVGIGLALLTGVLIDRVSAARRREVTPVAEPIAIDPGDTAARRGCEHRASGTLAA
ncbi:MAG: DedA family protein [Propioniciclava sp.]